MFLAEGILQKPPIVSKITLDTLRKKRPTEISITDLQEHWCHETVKSTMIYEMLKVLQNEYQKHFPEQPIINRQMSSLNRDLKRREYQKLMDRQRCSTLEDRIEHYTKKRRIVMTEDDEEVPDDD
jgi:tRNA pseudouridine38/39 synthase